jgi:hypothetical protein
MGYETNKADLPEEFTDLGEDMNKVHGMHPVDAASAAEKNHEEPKVYYPELHFEGEHAEKLMKHLKEHGTAHIHYKKVSESTHHETRHGKKETRHRVGLQIHGIKLEGGHHDHSAESHTPNNEDAIEKGLEAASESKPETEE